MYENLSDPMPVNKEIKLYTGTGNPALAEKIADILHLELQGLNIEKFANGEIYARFTESVRGDDVYFIQTLAGSNVNDLLMETLIVCDAAKRASCSKFIAVIPHYGYALPPASPSPPVWWPTCWRPPAWTRSSPSTCTRARSRASSSCL